MKTFLFKLFTIVIMSNCFSIGVHAALENNNVIKALRYDLWYQGIKLVEQHEEYDPPEVVESQDEENLDYPEELMIPLYENVDRG